MLQLRGEPRRHCTSGLSTLKETRFSFTSIHSNGIGEKKIGKKKRKRSKGTLAQARRVDGCRLPGLGEGSQGVKQEGGQSPQSPDRWSECHRGQSEKTGGSAFMAFQKVLSVQFPGPYRGGGGEGSKAAGFPPARGSAAQLSPCFEPLEGSRGSGADAK